MTRFHVDLLHPGYVARTWQDWFTGPRGGRRLGLFTLGCVGVLVVVLVAWVMPTYWRLSTDLNAVPRLRKDLAVAEGDLNVLRANLQALTQEARRQVRWAELLTTFSQQIPATLKLQTVEASRPIAAAPGGQPQAAARSEETLRIDAVTPLRPGSPPLLEIAQFMGGIMRDPAINKRFLLKSWEIKPPTTAGGEGQLLNITIMLTERVP